MPNSLSKLDNYKLETVFDKRQVVHSTYHWDFSTRVWEKSTWKHVKVIGSGGFGEVCLEKGPKGKLRAVKKLSQQSTKKVMTDYARELLVMVKLEDYTHLFLEFYGWYENKDNIFIAMEYIEHGDLSEHIKNPWVKEEVAVITRQILEGLEVLHKIGICHRDLKPENVLVASINPVWVKIADFGVSKRTKDTLLRTRCGTEGYTAPEILGALPRKLSRKQEVFTHALDIWSLGCLVYELLTLQKPFFDYTDTENNSESGISPGTGLAGSRIQSELDMGTLVGYCKGDIDFPSEALQNSQVSEEGIAFVKSLLTADPGDRPAAAHALQDPWLMRDMGYWFIKLKDEFMLLGMNLDLGEQEAILLRQIGKTDIMRFLPASAKKKFTSLLLEAAARGYSSAILRLLESPSNSLKTLDMAMWGKLFQVAANAGMVRTIKVLLQKKADVFIRINHRTLLQWVVEMGYFGIAIVLLENDANFNTSITHQEAFRLVTEVIRIKCKRDQETSQRPAKTGGIDAVMRILTRIVNEIAGEDGEFGDSYRLTALHEAAGSGYTDIVKLLLVSGAELDVALVMAAEGGHIDIVKLLLKNGADASGESALSPYIPLSAAAINGHVDIVNLLLDNGANVNPELTQEEGFTPLQAAAKGGYIDIVKLLLDNKANVNGAVAAVDGRTALEAASECGRADIVQLLLDNGANVNFERIDEEPCITSLLAAVRSGNIDIVKLLLDNGAHVNDEQGVMGGRTPLHAAAKAGNIEIVRLLLDNGADINSEDAMYYSRYRHGRTALEGASKGGHLDIIKLLLNFEADTSIALLAAVKSGNIDVVNLLLDNGAYVNLKPSEFRRPTPLEAAARGGDIDIVKLLLDNGANVNAEPTMTSGLTALQAAAEGGNINIVRLLLDNDADINAQPREKCGRTALQAAAGSGNIDIVTLLLDNGAHVNAKPAMWAGRTALQAAAEDGNINIVRLLLDNNADVNAKPARNSGQTALQAAAGSGNTEIVTLLLDNDADVNAKSLSEDTQTALQIAAFNGYIEITKLLLYRGACVNTVKSRNHDRTALELAVKKGHGEIVTLLLGNGADSSVLGSYSHITEVVAPP